MNENQRSSSWTEADEERSVAAYHATLTQQLGTWAHACCAGLLIPVIGTGAFGLFLLAGVVVRIVAIRAAGPRVVLPGSGPEPARRSSPAHHNSATSA
jgi:hypothetical protein